MRYELISFKICPFVQRSRITLLHKQVAHDITYIDLDEPPDWFRSISPLGKVPLLRVDGETVLFESAVINEFIDETTPPPLMPADPLLRARNRAWIEFGQTLIGHHYRTAFAIDAETSGRARADLQQGLARLEAELGDGPYFNGPQLSLVDTAFAPLWMHIDTVNRIEALVDLAGHPRLAAWSETLLALPAVRASVAEDFNAFYRNALRKRDGFLAARLAA